LALPSVGEDERDKRRSRRKGEGKAVDRIGIKEDSRSPTASGLALLCRAPEDKATGYVEETVKKFTGRKVGDQDEDEGKKGQK